jgi:hypothetical protein
LAYSPSNPIRLAFDMGFTRRTTSDGNQTYYYSSTHNSTDILATGFFTGVGAGSRGSLADLGVMKGDIIINRASTDAARPGQVSMHSVINSTANVLSTSASSGWAASYDITVSQSS